MAELAVFSLGLSCLETPALGAGEVFAGPLRASPVNPRYFTNDTGRAIYLTGSHTWTNFKDSGVTDPPSAFNYPAYLDFLVGNHHNFIRLWTLDIPKNNCGGGSVEYATPFPWPRNGPGLANDGKPKFDLSGFEESYFERLRSRVILARDRGIYVGIMLNDGYSLQFCRTPNDGYPFDGANNINGVSVGTSAFTLNTPAALAVQKAYARKLVDTVNDLDNVLYEIANEAGGGSTAWQYEMINTINQYQATLPKQHPVGMTYQWQGGDNPTLFNSPADWISPGGVDPYGTNPPAATGQKVIISDSDHIYGLGPGGDYAWVWRSFTRGLNPIYMDPLNSEAIHQSPRRAMGHTLDYARRLDLVHVTPRGDLASTSYCLANPGSEYLAYQPDGGSFTINLGGVAGTFMVEWFRPLDGIASLAANVSGGGTRDFTPPFSGSAVLYLRSTALPQEPSIKVAILAPQSGAVVPVENNGVVINTAASDRYGQITKVEIHAGGNLLGTLNSAPYSLTWNDVPSGPHILTAQATNQDGTMLVSEPVEILVLSLPTIHMFTVQDGIANFLLLGDPGARYRIDWSEDLKDWGTLKEVVLSGTIPGIPGASAVVLDAGSINQPRRFYRASQVP